MGAAKDFLKLLKHEGLPVFNPLHGEGSVAGGGDGGSSRVNVSNGERKSEVWTPVAKQLYNAVMWVIVIINADPKTPIFNIKKEVEECKGSEYLKCQVKAVNTIIGKNFSGKTLTEPV